MARKKNKLSIVDVADEAGVSRSTVSRVINNDPKASAPAVKAVRDAMQKLGYTPPPMDKRYRRPSRKPDGIYNGHVALFFPDPNISAEHTPLSAALIHGTSAALNENDLNMLVSHLGEEDSVPDIISNHEVDGVIVRGGEVSDSVNRKLKKLPIVWLFETSRRLLWGDQVFPDNQAAGEMAAAWQIEKGCKQPLIIYSDEVAAFRRRSRAYCNYLEEEGVKYSELSLEQLHDCLPQLVDDKAYDGIFVCGHDSDMLNVFIQLSQLGLKPGDHWPIITCVNNQDSLAALDVRIANIDIRAVDLARTAVETLVWRMKNPREPVRNILIAPRLIEAADQ